MTLNTSLNTITKAQKQSQGSEYTHAPHWYNKVFYLREFERGYDADNLLADHRTREAEKYLEIYKTLPAHRPFLVPIYEAYVALGDYDVEKADAIIKKADNRCQG